MKTDVYTKITDQIIAELEKGVRPWHKPWAAGHVAGPVSRPLRSNGKPYSGINVLMLWATAMERGYSAPIWMTFRQAQELGAHVRKGEKGATVVYASTFSKTEANENGEETERNIPFLKGYTVFNVEQIDGLPAHYTAAHAPRLNAGQRIEQAEAFFAATGADIRHGGDRAFYAPGPDLVQMPPFESFRDAGAYYGTLAHECTHWTKHKSRLDRDFGQKRGACPRPRTGGDNAYAMEELVAELGAAFLCADLELVPQIRDDHAPYIAGWLKALKDDKRAIFTAASHAQKAVDYLLSVGSPEATEDADSEDRRAA
jgi:antirestriction protein ArdC